MGGRAVATVCIGLLALLAASACALPPRIEILNAGKSLISVGLDYHSRTVVPGEAFVALYSGKDFYVTEGPCLFKYKGLDRAGRRALRLRWSGDGRLEAEPSAPGGPIAPISRQCGTELE